MLCGRRPGGEHASTERRRLVEPARQAAGFCWRSLEPRRDEPFLLHAPERDVDRPALETTTGGGDELQAIHRVAVRGQQLEDQRLDRRRVSAGEVGGVPRLKLTSCKTARQAGRGPPEAGPLRSELRRPKAAQRTRFVVLRRGQPRRTALADETRSPGLGIRALCDCRHVVPLGLNALARHVQQRVTVSSRLRGTSSGARAAEAWPRVRAARERQRTAAS